MEEKRGRPKEPEVVDAPRKFTKTYEDEDTIETWTYDLNKFDKGPILVEIKYKNGIDKPKNWNKIAKQAKDDRRQARQMKKINENNNTKTKRNAKKN
jgi:hypothetical protein